MFSEGVEGFSDPSLVVGSLGILQLHTGEGQPEAKSTPFLPPPLRSKGGFKALPSKANS
jgi:hypothetical protein